MHDITAPTLARSLLSENGAEVARLYRAALGRSPDLAGLSANVARLDQHTAGLHDVADALLHAVEFNAGFAGDDAALVTTSTAPRCTARPTRRASPTGPAGGRMAWTAPGC